MNNIVIFNDGQITLPAEVRDESVWLNQKQLCELFERDKSVISRHIRNIIKEGELDKEAVVAKNATTAADGKIYQVDYYNLDMVISVGYRVNSKRATKFRQWATKVFKEYIIKGYALNKEKLQQQKLQELEQTISLIKQGIDNQELSMQEAKGFVEIIGNYAKSWWRSFALKCNRVAVLTAEILSDSMVFATKVASPSICRVVILVTDKLQRDKKEFAGAWV